MNQKPKMDEANELTAGTASSNGSEERVTKKTTRNKTIKDPLKVAAKAADTKPAKETGTIKKAAQKSETAVNAITGETPKIKKAGTTKTAPEEAIIQPIIKKVGSKKVAAKKVAATALVPTVKKAKAAGRQTTTSTPESATPVEETPTAAPETGAVEPVENSEIPLPSVEPITVATPAAAAPATTPEIDMVPQSIAEETENPAIESIDQPADLSLVKVTFQIRYSTKPGEQIFVSGNHPALGSGDLDNALLLQYLDHEYWSGSVNLSKELSATPISYNYLVKYDDGSMNVEWGQDKEIAINDLNVDSIHVIDTWNASSIVENTFFTEPFQQVLLKNNYTTIDTAAPETTTHVFKVKAPLLPRGHALFISGNIPELGFWNTSSPLLLSRQQDSVWHTIDLDLSNVSGVFEYKYGVYNVEEALVVEFEKGDNRTSGVAGNPNAKVIVSDGFAQISGVQFKGAGVAIPVFSLRSNNGLGVGEFPDIRLLIDWAKSVGLKLVQVLPLNDTTATHQFTDSYPYAAISAFALHPLYLHLPSVVGDNTEMLAAIEDKQEVLNALPDVDYVGVMAYKWDVLKQVYPALKQATFARQDFQAFYKENEHWLVPYAAFSYLREKYNTSDFSRWPEHSSFNKDAIMELVGTPGMADDAIGIYFFVQFHLHLQLLDATNYAHQNGIIVKGDIPIGIYRNSCDAWQQPELYNMNMQAGAPPDDFAVKGQNWGFPTYNWKQMRHDGFDWWKKRFLQMSYYFDAFRIDHILGFFRIWSIPMDSVEGIMGHFVPSVPVHTNEIAYQGVFFDYQRFCKPYITDKVLYDVFGNNADTIKEAFLEPLHDGQYALKPDFDTQRKVQAHFSTLEQNEQNQRIQTGLYDLISNVLLFEVEDSNREQFHFRISMYTTSSYNYLDDRTKSVLYELYVNYFYRRQDDCWHKEAMLKLPELKRSTNMLICGEDLGMVPATVPGVMKELAILSLEIQRMPKDATREFFHPNDAPYLSVVTPSTHDMSTIRGWWEEDRSATQRFFNNELGQWGTAPYFCEPWVQKIILLQHFFSPAMWSIFQLQDLMGIDAGLRRENPADERINVPANPHHYWRYRMHITLEDLQQRSDFNNEIGTLVRQSGR